MTFRWTVQVSPFLNTHGIDPFWPLYGAVGFFTDLPMVTRLLSPYALNTYSFSDVVPRGCDRRRFTDWLPVNHFPLVVDSPFHTAARFLNRVAWRRTVVTSPDNCHGSILSGPYGPWSSPIPS